MNDNSWKTRLYKEKEELILKTVKIVNFMDSEKFEYLSEEDQNILKLQLSVMTAYIEILKIRCERIVKGE